MSDDDSQKKSNGHSNGGGEGTVLGDHAGVHLGSTDADEDGSEMPADFGSFIVSLGTSCMINLGRVENPETGGISRDIESAQHTIEIIEMLQQKTLGNLESQEERLLGSLLYDLRVAFREEMDKPKN